jgi:hypothetical protein
MLASSLLLHPNEPSEREQIIHQAAGHENEVWILRLDRPSGRAMADMQLIRSTRATLAEIVSAKSLVLHSSGCWSEAKLDVTSSSHDTQITGTPAARKMSLSGNRETDGAGRGKSTVLSLQSQLGNWLVRRYDFYSCVTAPPHSLEIFRARQQDARQYSHCGPLAATDVSVNLKKECMGASFVLVENPGSGVLLSLSAPIGGPLASLRAEAVGLLHLLRRAKTRFGGAIPLLIFIDCLALFIFFEKWGRSDSWPQILARLCTLTLSPLSSRNSVSGRNG